MKGSFVLLLILLAATCATANHRRRRCDDDLCPNKLIKIGVQLLGTFIGVDTELEEANVGGIPFVPDSGSTTSNCFTGDMLRIPDMENLGKLADCVMDAMVGSQNSSIDALSDDSFFVSNQAGSTILDFGLGHILAVRSFNDITRQSVEAQDHGVSSRITHWAGHLPESDGNYILRQDSKGDFGGMKVERVTTRLAGSVNRIYRV